MPSVVSVLPETAVAICRESTPTLAVCWLADVPCHLGKATITPGLCSGGAARFPATGPGQGGFTRLWGAGHHDG
jgi:hypothetical protein